VSKILLLLPIFAILQPLAGQQTTALSQQATPSVKVSNGPGAAFQFTKIDDDLLAEANAVDAQYEKKGLVLHDPGLQAYVDSVGKRILGDRPTIDKVSYRFMVLRDPMINAFALPNGSVYVTTGLLALLENEAQLAGVLGHETAHVYERHPYLEYRSVRKKATAINILAIAGSWAPIGPNTVGVLGAAIYAGAQVSSIVLVESVYGYSREMESQADRDGLASMAAIGYDPHAMADTFALLDKDRTLEYEPYHTIFHDHPKLTQRHDEALAFANAFTLTGARTGTTQDYLEAVAPAIVSNINTDIESRRPRTAVARATKIASAFPDDPEYQVLLGESYRALGAKSTAPTPDELTPDGEDKQRKLVVKMTEQQEQQKLLSTPEGRQALRSNEAEAEKLYLASIHSHPLYAPAYRELGFLYQDESRFADSVANYQHYLQLVAATSMDRLRIERRLAEVQNLQAAQAHESHSP
jgi:Zn-dependent protease with chaperone function